MAVAEKANETRNRVIPSELYIAGEFVLACDRGWILCLGQLEESCDR